MAKRWHTNALPHRVLDRHDADPQRGRDVRGLQRAVNKIADEHPRVGITKLRVDGEAGRQTLALARRAAHCQGLYPGSKTGVSVYVQARLRTPRLRTPGEKKRALKWQKEVREALAREKANRVTRSGNKVTGGTVQQRLARAMHDAMELYATGKRQPVFYDQRGAFTVEHGITGEPRDCRSDCSQYVGSMWWSADAPSLVRGGNVWTGTLVAIGEEIRRDQLELGCYIVYGPGDGHHVEAWYGDGEHTYAQLDRMGSALRDVTSGHGSPPVDRGDIDMMAGARFFRAPGMN
jgi:hypothetical protein